MVLLSSSSALGGMHSSGVREARLFDLGETVASRQSAAARWLGPLAGEAGAAYAATASGSDNWLLEQTQDDAGERRRLLLWRSGFLLLAQPAPPGRLIPTQLLTGDSLQRLGSLLSDVALVIEPLDQGL